MSEQNRNDATDAANISSAGYYDPSVEIAPAQTVFERRNGRIEEIQRSAFVKLYTAFVPEMGDIDPIALKVWLFIALSVNRKTGKAHPGLRTIAARCKLAINTVRAALDRLEKQYGLLVIYRKEKAWNIYEPAGYVSANRKSVSENDTDRVSADDTDDEPQDDTNGTSDSSDRQSVSSESETVSPRVILNQINQNNQKEHGAQTAPPRRTATDTKSDVLVAKPNVEMDAAKPFAEKPFAAERQVEMGALNNNELSNKELNNKEHGAQTAPPRRTAAKPQGDPLDGMIHYAKEGEQLGVVADRINAYPPDVQDTLRALVDLWGWPIVPAKPAKGARGGDFALWINDLREINSLISVHGHAALRAAHGRWADSKFTVSHPGALIRTIFAAVSELNSKAKKQQQAAERGLQTPFAALMRPDGTKPICIRPTRESLGLPPSSFGK